MLGKTEGRRRQGLRMRLTDGITKSMSMSLRKFWDVVKDREACHAANYGLQRMDSVMIE